MVRMRLRSPGGCRLKCVALFLLIPLLGWPQDLQRVLKQSVVTS
jgi:hypothetical protein